MARMKRPKIGTGGRSTAIVMSGAFFDRDPAETIGKNIRAMLGDLAADGERDVQSQLTPNHGRLSGALAGSIHGRVKSLTGNPWWLTAVVSSNLQALIAASRGQKSGHWHGSYAGFIETGLRQNDRLRVGSKIVMRKSGKLAQVGVYQRRRIGSSFRGYHMFRNGAAGLRVKARDLTKGLN